jgi:hypothetical protein
MAVTSVTITSGPTVVGRSVTISGTLSRDGGGTNNSFYFLCYDTTFTYSFTLRRLSDSSNLYDGSGTAGSGIAWTWTGALPEGNYLGITAYQSGTDAVLSSATAAIGIIKLTPGLPGIWMPRRDARGLFVPKQATSTAVYASGYPPAYGNHFYYPASDGVYRSAVPAVEKFGAYGGTAKSVPTQWGLGVDCPAGWIWPTPTGQSYTTASGTHILVSVFSLHNASKYVAASEFPAVHGESAGSNVSDPYPHVFWRNASGEQSLLVSISNSQGGTQFSINGLGNGLHCLVLVITVGGGASGLKAFLNGSLVATSSAPTYLDFLWLRPNHYYSGISQSQLDIGNILLNAEAAGVSISDSAAAALSLNPYRRFFVDAPTQKSRLSRLLSLGQSFQFSRPSADLLTGWTRVPAYGTHVSAINEITGNQIDYLSASAGNLIDSFTMDQLQQPASGGLDINLDIDASERPVTVDLLNGATVVKTQSVNTTGPATITVTPAELAGVSWPWTPTIRITSQ